MKIKPFLFIILISLISLSYGQKETIELSFTGIDNADYKQFDSIKIMNRSQGGDTVLIWPDTVLSLNFQLSISEIIENQRKFELYQNYPNPVIINTSITVFLPQRDVVSIFVTDLMGRVILKKEKLLSQGIHSFDFIPGTSGLYIITAMYQGQSSSIKIINSSSGIRRKCHLSYEGMDNSKDYFKSANTLQNFSFDYGDTLLYIGYSDTIQSGILDNPITNNAYILQFASNIPCLEIPAVSYEGQIYNTVQIFSQCWLKENLNVGTMIPGEEYMTDNEIIEKYCYDNEPDSCTIHGGLYQWWEMMQYTQVQGAQGICPEGWHIPTDEELKILEGVADSQRVIGDIIWDDDGYRGFDASINLKAISGWAAEYNGTDLLGFSAIPGGRRYSYGDNFSHIGEGIWWTSTVFYSDMGCARSIDPTYPGIISYDAAYPELGFSVRCLKD